MFESNKPEQKLKFFSDHGRLTNAGNNYIKNFRDELIVLVAHASQRLDKSEMQTLEGCLKSLVGEVFSMDTTHPWEDK